MKFQNFVKRYLIEIIVSLVFVAFLGWLIYIAIVGTRSPLFIVDTLDQVVTPSSYTSNLNFFRGIFEPIIGSFLIVGLEFEYWIMILIILYPTIRAIILILDKFRYEQRLKSNTISLIFQDALRFTFIWGLLVFLLGIITFGIGYLVVGVLFLSNNFRWILKVVSWASMSLFTGKLVYNIIMRGIKRNNNHLKFLDIRTKLLSKIRQIKLKNFMISSKKEIMKFLATFWFVLMLTQAMQYIYFPTQTVETTLGPNEFLFDLHCHTTYSDGVLTPRQRVNWYMDQGIHGAAFSDHHNLGGAIHAQEYVDRKNLDFTVIKAQEFTDDPEGIHLNIYGETDTVVIPDNYWGEEDSDETLSCREAIEWAKSEGLYVTVNHYETNATAPFTFEQLRDWGVDGFEIVNGAREQGAGEIRQFCLDNNLICMAGTDVHMNEDLDTFVKLTLADPNNKTVDAIFEALYQNTHEVVYIKYRPEENYSSIDLLEDLINYFHGLSLFQSLSWIAWTLIGVRCIFNAN